MESAIDSCKNAWNKVEELFEDAMEMYPKLKKFLQAGLDLIAKPINKIKEKARCIQVTFTTTLKAATSAEIGFKAKIGSNEYTFQAKFATNFLQKVAEVAIESVSTGYSKLKDGILEAWLYIRKMITTIKEAKNQLENKEEPKNVRKRSTVPTAREMEIKRLIYDPLPRPVMNDYITMSLFESFKPNSMMPETDALPMEKVSVIQNDNPAKRGTINGK